MEKSDSKLNAFKHGAYIAEDSNLWGENYEDHEKLIEDLHLEWQPSAIFPDSAVLTCCRRHCRSKYRLASSWHEGVGLFRFLPFVP